MPMNDQVKESALDQVSQQHVLVTMEQGNPESFAFHIVKVAYNLHVSSIAAPVLQEIAVSIVVPEYPDYSSLKPGEDWYHERRDEIPGMEKEVVRFTVQELDSLPDSREVIMSVTEYADSHINFLPIPDRECPEK